MNTQQKSMGRKSMIHEREGGERRGERGEKSMDGGAGNIREQMESRTHKADRPLRWGRPRGREAGK